jgi:hypothetical protein
VTNVCTLGIRNGSVNDGTLVDFNDQTRYRYTSNDSTPPNPQYERQMRPNRGQPGSQLVIERMLGTPIEFDVYCLGDPLDLANGYQLALDRYAEIIDLLSKASKFSKPGREGVPVFFTKQVRDQLAPQSWQVSYGEFRRSKEELEAGNIIFGRLILFCSPIPTAGVVTTKTSPILCNYDTWTVNVGGTEPIQAKVSVFPLGAAPHYDRIRVTNLAEASGVAPANHVWPFLAGPGAPPADYGVEALTAGRIASVVVTIRAKGTGTYQLLWRDGGGTNWLAGPVTVCDDGAAYKTYTHDVSVNPATELPYTEADLNAGQWGVQKIGGTSVRITQLYVTAFYLDRDMVSHSSNLLPNADGASTAWGLTGAGSTFDCLNDAVGADDGDTTYISSTTDGQVSLIAVPDYTADTGLDVSVRAHVKGVGGFKNGGMEAPYSGPSFGATLVDDPVMLNGGYFPRTDIPTFGSYDSGLGAWRVAPVPGRPPNYSGFMIGGYGGLTPGVAIRFQCDMRTSTGVPEAQGARIYIQDGADRGFVLRAHTTTFTTQYVDFIPLGETISVYLMVEGTLASALFRAVKIREVESVADGWTLIGSASGYQELATSITNLTGSSLAGYVVQGDSSQGVGPGDPSNCLEQTFGVIDGESYRVVALIRDRGIAPKFFVDPTGFNFRVVSGANEEILTTFDTVEFERVEATIQADGNSMTLQAYANDDGAGYVDGVFVQRVNSPTDFGSIPVRVTLDQNVVDYYGPHQVWARIRAQGAPVQVQVRYGGTDGQLIASNPVIIEPSTGVRSAKLGAVVIPPTATDPDAPIDEFLFSVLLFPTEGSAQDATVDFDAVELWPAKNSILALSLPNQGPAPTQKEVFDGGSRIVYVASAGGGTIRTTANREGNFVTLYPGRNRIFARVSRAADDDHLCPDDTFRLQLAYSEAGIVRHVFSPADLATRFDYWYRAYELATGALAVWPDQSGHGRDTTLKTGTVAVVGGQLNGLPIVRFTGGLLRIPEIAFPSGAQILILAKIDTAIFQGTLLRTSATPGPNYGIGIAGTELWVHRYSDNNNNAVKKHHVTAGVPLGWALYTLTDDGTGGLIALRINGGGQTLVPNAQNISGASGINPDGTLTTDVAQIIIAHDLTDDELSDLESFVMSEAGI